MDKETIKFFLRDNTNLALILLLAFSIILRLFYFFKLGIQPVWWDEGDYLAISKVWSIGMQIPEWWSHFTGMRPILLPLIWTIFFKAGLGELSIRFFTILLPSLGTIYLTYLLGKDLYSKKVGIIASLMMSTYWVFFFYSFRLLTDIPSVFLGLAAFYLFWTYYIKERKSWGLYLSIFFGVLAFSIRFPLALVLISCAIYLLFIKKWFLFKDRTFWKALALLVALLSPYMIYFISTKFFLFNFYFGEGAVSIKQKIAWNLIPMIGILIHSTWAIAFIIGLITFIPLVIGFDVVWKQKNKTLNSDLFVFIWLLVHFIFYVIIFRAGNDRWLLMLMPAIFLIASRGIISTYDFLKKYSKGIATVVLILFLAVGAYQNLNHGIELTEQKKLTYNEIKIAGEWLKENSPKDSKVITASIVQNQYYSERQSYDFFSNKSALPKGCTDLLGNTLDTEECQTASEKIFNEKISEVNPNYLIVSIFEPVFTPKWVYTYPERNNLTALAAFPNNQQPALVIYRFN